MSPKGRPEGESDPERDSAKGSPVGPKGRPEGESTPKRVSAEGSPMGAPDPEHRDDADPVPHPSPVVRWVLLVVGLVAVALGVVGAFLPVLPTTPFLLVGAACFARASPRLHRRLAESKTFGPTLAEWRRHRAIAWRTKCYALVLMSLSIAVSAIFFVQSWWGKAALVALGVTVGTWLWHIPSRDRPSSAKAGRSQTHR